uniref:Uncharacterized protein n=1 Tax=Ignisphaera aggregans TaxID=334771 RepID=A0A7J3Z8T6_9CREN
MAVLKTYRFYLKSLIKDPYYWFWAVFFMLFWLVMGAFIYGSTMTKDSLRRDLEKIIPPSTPMFESILEDMWNKSTLYYTGSWYSSTALYSLTTIAMGLVHYIYYSTIPIRYLTKYSKASSTRFYTGLTLASLTTSLIATGILVASTIILYSYKFHELNKFILPKNPLGVFTVTVTGGVFMFFFSTTLALLVVAMRKPRLLGMLSFVPLMLSYALGMYGLMAGGGLVHLSPFNIILLLAFHYYTESPISLNLRVVDMWRADPEVKEWFSKDLAIQLADPAILWIILGFWILITAGISLILLRVQKGVSVEEILS